MSWAGSRFSMHSRLPTRHILPTRLTVARSPVMRRSPTVSSVVANASGLDLAPRAIASKTPRFAGWTRGLAPS